MRRYYYRFKAWISEGPVVTLREFLVAFTVLFLINTVVIGFVMYLTRENQQRITDVHGAVVKSCKDSNEVRSEVREVIQDVKNTAPYIPWHTDVERWLRLTRAQARLADKRCLSP